IRERHGVAGTRRDKRRLATGGEQERYTRWLQLLYCNGQRYDDSPRCYHLDGFFIRDNYHSNYISNYRDSGRDNYGGNQYQRSNSWQSSNSGYSSSYSSSRSHYQSRSVGYSPYHNDRHRY
ncbi:hypothetical protein L9F63_006605, partial [Diploptera punctata]